MESERPHAPAKSGNWQDEPFYRSLDRVTLVQDVVDGDSETRDRGSAD